MCEALEMNGATYFICRGRRQHPEKLCRFCKVKFTSRLCDYEEERGKTCDAEMCSSCATRIGRLDICPDHCGIAPQGTLFAQGAESNDPAREARAHATRTLLGQAGPWQLNPLQRELLRILLFHQGAQRAITLRDLIGKLHRATGVLPTEREIKEAARGLVVDFKVRVGASRSAHRGYYLITTAEEARDTASLYVKEIRKLAQRVRVLLDPHDLAELEGQRIFSSDPDPKEAA
jgi:hypothetical protein